MTVRRALGVPRWWALETLGRRELELGDVGPVVSFTFDDFPKSALDLGGAILARYGLRGTFYAAMGQLGQTTSVGRIASASDLARLLDEGHELGNHSYAHPSGRSTSPADYERDVIKGMTAVDQVIGDGREQHFSYPSGHVTFRLKTRIGARTASCRGIVPGINESPVDLNLLRANALYSSSIRMDSIARLLERNVERRGWLIFYTHDLAEQPSAFGCTPAEFEEVVALVAAKCPRIATIGQVIDQARSAPRASTA